MDAPTGVPFFFSHPNPDLGLIGPKVVTRGKVDIVKAPEGNYSGFAIIWQMSLLRPYMIKYLLDNGTTMELTEPIKLKGNMKNIQLYFRLWNLTIDTWSQDPFRLINVNVTLFSVSDFQLAPDIGISQRMIELVIDKYSIYSKYVLPEGWKVCKIETDQHGYPVIYYHTDTQTNIWNVHPHWGYLPEKNYWIWVNVPNDLQKAMNAGFRAVDANTTLYWSGDPWNKPFYLNQCYNQNKPLVLKTYIYNPGFALKTERGTPLLFDETNNSALILAEPWEDSVLFYKQQINPLALVVIETSRGKMAAGYDAYFLRKNATDPSGVIFLHSVNATDPDGKGTWSPNDPDLCNPVTGCKARKYPNQSRYLIGESTGVWQVEGVASPVKESKPKYRIMVYYKGVLVYNESISLSNPYVSKLQSLSTFKQVTTTRLNITIVSEAGKPLEKAKVCIIDVHNKENLAIAETDEKGMVYFDLPLRSETSYEIAVEWTSKYGTKAALTASVTAAETSISLPVYDVTLRLLTLREMPLAGIPVKVASVDVGTTSATGEVIVPQIPPGTYTVVASWLDTALNLPLLRVSAPDAVTLTPSNVHMLAVRVAGAQGQALEGATVTVSKDTVKLTKKTNRDGMAEIELPDASYIIEVTYGQFRETDSVSLTADTLKTFNLDVFVEFLGVAMSMTQFLLLIIITSISLAGLSGIIIVKRKSKLLPLRLPLPPPPLPTSLPPFELEKEIKKYEGYLEKLEQLKKEGRFSQEVYEKLKAEYESKIEELKKKKVKPT
ncbi:MAG: hypothetical protein QXT64_07285 [Desulfurococcaceae archaeon]